jgi:hypothetical protein
MLAINWTSCHTCLFEFIRVEGGVKFMTHFKGGESNKSLGTSGLLACWATRFELIFLI